MAKQLYTRIPFAFARSALFRPGNALIDMEEDVSIPAANDYSISINYSGPSLTPTHALVWQSLIAMAYDVNGGTTTDLDVKIIDLLKVCGRTSVQTYAKKWIRKIIDELSLAHVSISTPRHRAGFEGNLISWSWAIDEGSVQIGFDKHLSDFLSDEFVHIPLDSKKKLLSYPMAAWLHDYISTHKDVYRVPVTTLHRLMGSFLEPSLFKARLVDALRVLEKQQQVLTRFEIKDGVLTLHKRKTKVVLLKDEVAGVKVMANRKSLAIRRARQQRIKVAL